MFDMIGCLIAEVIVVGQTPLSTNQLIIVLINRLIIIIIIIIII